jgi:hypothetical protein
MAYRLGATPSTQRKHYPVLEINADGQTFTHYVHVPPQASSGSVPAPKRVGAMSQSIITIYLLIENKRSFQSVAC